MAKKRTSKVGKGFLDNLKNKANKFAEEHKNEINNLVDKGKGALADVNSTVNEAKASLDSAKSSLDDAKTSFVNTKDSLADSFGPVGSGVDDEPTMGGGKKRRSKSKKATKKTKSKSRSKSRSKSQSKSKSKK